MFQLVFCDKELSYEDHREMFCIGIFSSFDKAKETAEDYLHHVEGFKDYDCYYEIIEKDLEGHGGSEVFVVCGWDENEDMDEVNIIESHCFEQEDAARGHMLTMQQNYDRMRWSVSRYVVDQCLWKEGFVRV